MSTLWYKLEVDGQPIYATYNLENSNNASVGDTETYVFDFNTRGDQTVQKYPNLTVSDSYTVPQGETEQYSVVTVEATGTLTVNGTLGTAEIVIDGSVDGSGSLNVVDYWTALTITTNEVAVYDTLSISAGNSVVVNGVLQAQTIDNDGELDNNNTVLAGAQPGFERLLDYDEYVEGISIQSMLDGTQTIFERKPPSAPVDSHVIGIEPAPSLENEYIRDQWGVITNLTDAREEPLNTDRIELEVTILAPKEDYADRQTVINELTTTL
jgi:hypothetical protein